MNVEKLRKNGCLVRVTHKRKVYFPRITSNHTGGFHVKNEVDFLTKREIAELNGTYLVSHNGGTTTVEVTDPLTGLTFTGKSFTHENDNFVRKTGLTKALGRAVSQMVHQLPKVLEFEHS